MPVSKQVLDKLDQVEREVSTAMSEYPSQIALDRLKFVRALVRFVKTQLDIEDDATVPIPGAAPESRERH